MCGGSPASHAEISAASDANTAETITAAPLPDGYWVQAFQFRNGVQEYPDVIGYGLGFEGAPSTVRLYINPLNEGRCARVSPSLCAENNPERVDGKCLRSRRLTFLLG